MERIFTQGKAFVDEHSRQRIFNGINITFKDENNSIRVEQIYPAIDFLVENGLNLVRLGVNWSCLEKEPDVFDEEQFLNIKKFMDKCAQNNIYVFIDIHQDLYANLGKKSFNGFSYGDGAPKWACMTGRHNLYLPYLVWAQGYFLDKSVWSCFDHFWNNDKVYSKGLLEHFETLWKRIAKEFASHPAFFGFDFFNEPYIGADGGKAFKAIIKGAIKTTLSSQISKKELALSLTKKEPIEKILSLYDYDTIRKITSPADKYVENFDKNLYTPFINRMTKAVREVTDNGIILLENNYYSNLGIPFSAQVASVDGKREENQAFSPHAYDLMVDTQLYKYASNERVEGIFNQRKLEQDTRLNMPVIVGEWGGQCPNGTDWLKHIEYLLDLFDKNKWSHTYYFYHPYYKKSPVVNLLKRPYPIAVTGQIVSYHHNRRENTFYLEYNQDNDYDCPTEIFAHKKIKKIETDSEYEIVDNNNDTFIVKLKTNISNHKIKIYFE
jgi:endoglycosylceramidase